MKIIRKDRMRKALDAWSEEYTVTAPQRKSTGECLFDDYDASLFTLDYGKTTMPLKSLLFPQSEAIFRIEKGKYMPRVSKGKALAFGVRSCDLRAMLQSRSFMSKDSVDTYFETRSENTATVVMACNSPLSPSCFCTTTLSGPWLETGFDLELFDMGESFLVLIGSARGESLATLPFFEEAGHEAEEALSSMKEQAIGRIPVLEEVREAITRLRESESSDEIWERLGKKCITCGGCSFVCPTCTCFTIADTVEAEGQGNRVRTWDTCLYAGFTKEASGHNPRKTQGLRLKRRHEHKLRYYHDRDNHGSLATCVGCGRCSDSCPVHIGTAEVAHALCSQLP